MARPTKPHHFITHKVAIMVSIFFLTVLFALASFVFLLFKSHYSNSVAVKVKGGIVYYPKGGSSIKVTPTPTSQLTRRLDQLISYTVPEDWKLNTSDPNYTDIIELYSPDYETNPIPAVINGASLTIYNEQSNNKSVLDFVRDRMPTSLKDQANSLKPLTFGTTTYEHLFSCYEGCYDHYYLPLGNTIVDIVFECSASCMRDVNKNEYTSVRNRFLTNLKVKAKK